MDTNTSCCCSLGTDWFVGVFYGWDLCTLPNTIGLHPTRSTTFAILFFSLSSLPTAFYYLFPMFRCSRMARNVFCWCFFFFFPRFFFLVLFFVVLLTFGLLFALGNFFYAHLGAVFDVSDDERLLLNDL